MLSPGGSRIARSSSARTTGLPVRRLAREHLVVCQPHDPRRWPADHRRAGPVHEQVPPGRILHEDDVVGGVEHRAEQHRVARRRRHPGGSRRGAEGG
jgi:hypothetical protein